MRPSTFLASTLLGLAAADSLRFTTPSLNGGFTIPAGTADGVYAVQTHDNGTANHVRLDPARPGTMTPLGIDGKPTMASPPRRLAKRQWRYFWRVFCPATPQRLDASETDAAVDDVKHQCGANLDVPSGWHIYAVRGSVASFYCNFVSTATSCSSNEFDTRAAEITGTCGPYIAGWNNQVAGYGDPVMSEYNVGSYGYHNVGGDKNFCGRNHG